ncbi:MAG TPA: amidase [Mycobacteriales bacterium]|nr:amidase [Mycobacteriales bacterium]
MFDEITWLSAWEIRDLIVQREISATAVTEHFLQRIEEFDPVLHAFAHVDTDGARERAASADRDQRQGAPLGLLHGVPIAVKENIEVEGMPYSMPRLGVQRQGRYDDILVERLRSAGAVIVGKNSMMGTGQQLDGAAQGGSDRRGSFNWELEARNPWDLSRVPGWSSSGPAAATAAALVPVAIGGDGGGSTRLPAAYSGVLGLHPTQGLIPFIDYTHPTFRLTGTSGPLARHARDAALIMQAVAGPDGRDYICLPHDPPDYIAPLSDGLRDVRLAWTDDFGFASRYATSETSRIIGLARDAVLSLTTHGARIDVIDISWEPALRGGGPAQGEPSVYDIEVTGSPAQLPPTDPEAYRAAAEWRARNWKRFRDVFNRYDLIVSVTSPRIAPTIEDWKALWGSDYLAMAEAYVGYTVLANLLGLPAISIPCGYIDGMPIGLQAIGPPCSEHKLFSFAASFEQAFPAGARPPVS